MNNYNKDNKNVKDNDRKLPLSDIETPGEREVMPKNLSLAMAYIPFQMWSDDLFEIEVALERGTIFPELYKPFLGGKSRR